VRNRQATPDERVLGAGQSWSAGVGAPAPAASNPVDSVTRDDENPSASDGATPDEKSPSPVPPAALASLSNAGKAPDAKDLFEAAQLARINGNLRDSADSLNKLRKTYPSDPRAGLAAFELARMRMDTFGDISGSIDALRDAIRLSPNAPFREDAEARLVQLYSRRSDPRCSEAKALYLQRYPNGTASKVVRRLCMP